MGTILQPLVEDYDQCHHWITPSWLKTIWEKAKRFDIKVQFAPLPLEPSRRRDSWIMKDFIQLNCSPQELRQLNRVRMHQQVIFLSDVRDVSGRALDKKYLHPRPYGNQWSMLSFPKGDPSDEDFLLWKEALLQIRALGGRLQLGVYQRIRHKIWQWIYDIKTLPLFHCHKQGVDLWEPALGEGTSIQRANRYVCTDENTAVKPRGCPSTTTGTRAECEK